MSSIETDYLVIGSGAVGMAFVDTLIAETDCHVTLVDRRGKPGGHWNDAYSFVALHQPSAFYGVNSTALGSQRKDTHGHNAGMYELASGAEVSGYYDTVLRQQLLPTGRVTYLPMADYRGDGRIVSLMSGEERQVTIRRKTVNAAYGSPVIPATHTRRFTVADGVRVIAPGELPQQWRADMPPPKRYVVLGGGKTAMDAIGWLLAVGVPPDTIQWIKPRESWLINRQTTQPGVEFFDDVFGGQIAQMRAFAEGTSVPDIFARLEEAGVLLRVDPDVQPSMFHYATIAQAEVDQLRRVTQVVRKGRVQAIAAHRILLDQGEEPAVPDTLHIDCTASAVEPRATQPIFQGDLIVPQLVRVPQPCFSAALIAYVEAHYPDDEVKNALCRTVPFPNDMHTYLMTNIINLSNQGAWMADKTLMEWIRGSRLDGFSKVAGAIDRSDKNKITMLNQIRQLGPLAVQNLMKLAAPSATMVAA